METTECHLDEPGHPPHFDRIGLPFLMVHTIWEPKYMDNCTCTTKLQAVRPQFLCAEEPNTASR